MAVTIVSCYFLPFLFFFFAHFAFPKSILPFVLGIATLSISSLILYFQMLTLRTQATIEALPASIPQTPAETPTPSPKISYQPSHPITGYAKNALTATPRYTVPNTKRIIQEQNQALLSQKNLFTEELEKRSMALSKLEMALTAAQAALVEKEAECTHQAKELQDLKFELYTLLRIESYAGRKEQTADDTSKLATASF